MFEKKIPRFLRPRVLSSYIFSVDNCFISLFTRDGWPIFNRLAIEKFEIHSTPKHRRWLSRAATEIAALDKTCLAKRIDNTDTFRREIEINVSEKNKSSKPVQWHFSVQKTRCKLQSLYQKFIV